MDVRIRHLTRYRFDEPVILGEHQLMLRPRDSFDLEILSARLALMPEAQVSWRHDAYGNPVAVAEFAPLPVTDLTVESELLLRRHRPSTPTDAMPGWQAGSPIAYTPEEAAALAPYITPDLTDPQTILSRFAAEAVQTQDAPHPLIALSNAIHGRLAYRLRMDPGTQTPVETLALGQGSCRDYAWLFIEAARHLGYAARFVTGYLLDRTAQGVGMTAPTGFTHAWADAYIPGDGWVEFDPTNSLVADRQLFRVAVTRTPQEAKPVAGSFTGTLPPPSPEVSVQIDEVEAEIPDHEKLRGLTMAAE